MKKVLRHSTPDMSNNLPHILDLTKEKAILRQLQETSVIS